MSPKAHIFLSVSNPSILPVHYLLILRKAPWVDGFDESENEK